MGTHPIFESDFDCLTDWCRRAVMNRIQSIASITKQIRTLSLTNKSQASWKAGDTKTKQSGGAASLPKLQMRSVPYFRKGTKPEARPPLHVCRKAFDFKAEQAMPNSIEITSKNYNEGDYTIKVKTLGDDARDYASFNFHVNDPAFISRTVMVQDCSDPTSVALAYGLLDSIQKKEGTSLYQGHGFRFRERHGDKRRRLAYFEAKRHVGIELERKKQFALLGIGKGKSPGAAYRTKLTPKEVDSRRDVIDRMYDELHVNRDQNVENILETLLE